MQRLGKTRSAVRKFPERDRGATSFFPSFSFLPFFLFLHSVRSLKIVSKRVPQFASVTEAPRYRSKRISSTRHEDTKCIADFNHPLFTARENFYASPQFATFGNSRKVLPSRRLASPPARKLPSRLSRLSWSSMKEPTKFSVRVILRVHLIEIFPATASQLRNRYRRRKYARPRDRKIDRESCRELSRDKTS